MRKLATLFIAYAFAGTAFGSDAATKLDFSLFIDSYYAFDVNQPPAGVRSFTTLPTRHNEFTVNLAYIDARISGDRVHGRLALQAGTSALALYSSESRDSTKSGVQLADLLMLLQEAYAGYRISEGLWIDAGIFFSHIGMEGFISKDNWTYTRSLVADFSPYYQAGLRVTYEPSPVWGFQFQVLNGWQNVVENNSDKAVGTQISFHPTKSFSVIHNAFIGRETEFRIFQDLIVKYQILPQWESGIAFDFGLQRRPGSSSFAAWSGASLQNRIRVGEETHLGLRAEYYSDKEGIIVPTGSEGNFQAFGASVNIDRQLTEQLLWRTELRFLSAMNAIFPAENGPSTSTTFGITSLSLSL